MKNVFCQICQLVVAQKDWHLVHLKRSLKKDLLPPANKAKYIILMCTDTDLHNAALMDAYHEDVNTAVTNSESPSSVTLPALITPDQFVESNEVFEPLLVKRGMKTKLIASRKDLHNELLRRKPDAFTARLT
jgi:hypothetical protein